MSILTPVKGEHADTLFPLIKGTKITDTIMWDGPTTLEEYKAGLFERQAQVESGSKHMFTILDPQTGKPVGSLDIRPDEENFRASVGLWIAEIAQGKGIGTAAIKEITKYGFDKLGLTRIEACIFAGNIASRKLFEKCSYRFEGTLRAAVRKRGKPVDEWILGILKGELK